MIGKQYGEGKFKNRGYDVAICIGTILRGLIKESFTLIIPAFIALKYWMEYSETANGTQLGTGNNALRTIYGSTSLWGYPLPLMSALLSLVLE